MLLAIWSNKYGKKMAKIFEVAGCSNGFEHLFDAPFKQPSLNYGVASIGESYSAVCFCCFATDVPLTNANKCSHKEFVNVYLVMAPSIPLLICNICHHMLKKIEDFRLQIQNNFRNLVSKKDPDERCIIVNNLKRNPTISIVSLKPETIDNTGSQDNDPLSAPSEVDSHDSFVDNLLGTPGVSSEVPIVKTEPDEAPNTAVSQNTKDTKMPGTQFYIELTPTPTIKQETLPPTPPSISEGPIHQKKPTITINNGLILLKPLKNNSKEIKVVQMALNTPLIPHPKLVQTKKIVKKVSNTHIVEKQDTLLNSVNKPLKNAINSIKKVNIDEDNETDTAIGKLLKNYEYRRLDFIRRYELYNPDKDKPNQKNDKITNYKDTVIDESYTDKIDIITLTEEEIIKERENERLEETFAKNKNRCESCIETFQYDFSLNRHNERFHSKKNNDVECPICKRRYMSEKNMEDHSRKHFVRYVCLVCNLRSKTLPSLTQHYNKTHTDKEPIKKKYECEHCDFVSYYRGTYNHHRYNLHKLFMCKVCNQKLTGSASYKYHMKLCHDDVKETKNKVVYNCDQCTASFASCGLYTYHKKTLHAAPGTEPTPVFCQPCNKFLSNKIVYKSHLKYSAAHAKGSMKFECDYCHKIYPYKPTLQVHIQRQHLKNVNLKCEICNKSFAANRDLTQHVRRVHTNKNQPREVCYVCGKDYVSKAVLKKHIRIHTGERPHACDLCGMTFTQSSTLYTHKKLKHKVPKKSDIVKQNIINTTAVAR